METAEDIIAEIARRGRSEDRAGMAKFGINVDHAHGVSVRQIRELAKPFKRRHDLACALWASGVHEARIMASIIDDPTQITRDQLEMRVAELDSWDTTDGFAGDLVANTPFAWAMIEPWAHDEREFVRRAGFALLARLAVRDKTAADDKFANKLDLIRAYAADDRNFVKKAVNWALRQIGKRNRALNSHTVALANELIAMDSKAARWTGRDALRELTSEKVQSRL